MEIEAYETYDDYTKAALNYAWDRWYWDDTSAILELIQDFRQYHSNPKDLIDECARDFGFDDPNDPWGPGH